MGDALKKAPAQKAEEKTLQSRPRPGSRSAKKAVAKSGGKESSGKEGCEEGSPAKKSAGEKVSCQKSLQLKKTPAKKAAVKIRLQLRKISIRKRLPGSPSRLLQASGATSALSFCTHCCQLNSNRNRFAHRSGCGCGSSSLCNGGATQAACIPDNSCADSQALAEGQTS